MNVSQYGFKLKDSFMGLLPYADDVVLSEESQWKVNDMFLKLKKCTAKVEIQRNEENVSIHDC